MRAMAGLAQSIELQGRLKEAADVQADMLRLNPGDNQGIRDPHVAVLIALGRLDRARAILESEEYRDDDSAMWNFAGALVAFKQGREDDAARLLKAGVKGNRFVAPMILNPDLMPPGSYPTWSPGDESEAVMVAELLGDAWASDAAALGWLESASRPAPRKRPGKRNDRKPKGRKPKK
jgi:hypothetical protein